jgi:hypothetical protein
MRTLLVAATLALAASPALANDVSTMHATPTSVAGGHKVRVHGILASCPVVTLLSKAFKSKHEFAGVPSVNAAVKHAHYSRKVKTIKTPGTYTISGRCGGGNIGATAKITIT